MRYYGIGVTACFRHIVFVGLCAAGTGCDFADFITVAEYAEFHVARVRSAGHGRGRSFEAEGYVQGACDVRHKIDVGGGIGRGGTERL